MTLRDRLSAFWFVVSGKRAMCRYELARLEARMSTDQKMRDHLRERLKTAIRDHQKRAHIALRYRGYTASVLDAERRAAAIRAELQQKGAKA